jgi:hypothetical protein
MIEIEIMAAPGIGCFKIKIGRTLLFFVLTLVSTPHFHW